MRMLLILASIAAYAQTGQISGIIIDSSGGTIPDASVLAVNQQTGIRRSAVTGANGVFILSGLWPGPHKVLVYRTGFQAVSRLGVSVGASEHIRLDFTLQLRGHHDSIQVEDVPSELVEHQIATGGIIERDYLARLPLNGRNILGLLDLVPGIVLTPVTSAELGQFSAVGQRANANYVTVDGLSANFGVHGGGLPGQMAGGTIPGASAFGTMHTLGPLDAIQETKVQTSTTAPEFGRTPGAQITIITRSGTNQHHGSLFHYLRNEKLDANDWFANRQGYKRAALRVNDFGVSGGGALRRSKTFYFGAYEALTLRQPTTVRLAVPSNEYRRLAPSEVRPLVESFPIPTGPDIGRGLAEAVLSISRPSGLQAISGRLDHIWSDNLRSFLRLNLTPSETKAGTLAIGTSRLYSQSVNAGLTIFAGKVVNELRANIGIATARSQWELSRYDVNNAINLADFLPNMGSSNDSFYSFALGGSGQLQSGSGVWQTQRQFNLIDSVSLSVRRHFVRAGIDFRQLLPARGGPQYTIGAAFGSLDELFAGYASLVTFSRAERAASLLRNWSMFVQDEWRVRDDLTLTYGLRWEINPPPRSRPGKPLYIVRGLNDPDSISLAEPGTPLWRTRWRNFAPRVGAAYSLNQKTVIRGGVGIFYDLGFGVAMDATTGAPYTSWSLLSSVRYPFGSGLAADPPPSQPPFFKTYAYPGEFHLPLTWHWNAALERALSANDRFVLGYVGSRGRRLLRREALVRPNSDFVMVEVSTNRGESAYHGLQAQYRRRMSRGVDAMVSYAWAHSIDNVSQDSALLLGIEGFDASRDRGSSAFDVRHTLTTGFITTLPRGWTLDGLFRARTGFPIDVVNGEDLLGLGFANVFRPDRVGAEPTWIANSQAPGGRALNPSAFSPPSGNGQGNLGRNAVQGFGMWQLDVALRREFRLSEQLTVQLGAEAFNILNRANFGDPNRFLIAPSFGQSQTMLNGFLSTGGPAGGLAPAFQIGGPRSMQISLRVSF